MTQLVSDTFTGTSGDNLTTYDANWVKHTSYIGNFGITGSTRVRPLESASGCCYYYNSAPPSADYSVSVGVVRRDAGTANTSFGPVARVNTAANTMYAARWVRQSTRWELIKLVGGTATGLGTNYTQDLTVDQEYVCTLICDGDQISVEIDGVLRIGPVTDTAITAAGFPGIRESSSVGVSTTVGVHGDNFSVDTLSASAVPVAFTGSVPVLLGQSGVAFSSDLSSYFSGTETPFSYSLHAGTLHTGLSLNASTAVISGTPSVAGGRSGFIVRGTDSTPDTADSNSFAIDIAAATLWTETQHLADHSFAGPPKACVRQAGRVFFGTVRDSDHAVMVHRLAGSTLTSTVLKTHAGSADVHNNPGLHIDASGYIYAVTTPHGSSENIEIYKSTAPYGSAYTLISSIAVSAGIYYPTLLEYGGLMYLFVGAGGTRNVVYKTSSDGGVTWGTSTTVFEAAGRAYFMLAEIDGELVMNTTTYNESDVAYGLSSLYFARFDGTNWKTAGGSNYTLPVSAGTAEVCWSATGTSANAGFFAQCSKDSTGRFVVNTSAFTSSVTRKMYMCRFASGSWSQSEIVHPVATTWASTPMTDPDDPYRFLALAEYAGVAQWCMVESADDGATRTFTRITSGSLTRARGQWRLMFGEVIPDKWLMYGDEDRSSNTTWTNDIHAPFADSGMAAATSLVVELTGATSKTALQWALFGQSLPAGFTAPVAQGAAEATNGSDEITIDLTGLGLFVGDAGFLLVTDSDGTLTQSPAPYVAAGPVVFL
jgi:hypothetical protein